MSDKRFNTKGERPESDRLNCPECAEFFHLDQEKYLERHLLVDHDKAHCPHCNKLLKADGVPRHVEHSCLAVVHQQARKAREAKQAIERQRKLHAEDQVNECPECKKVFDTDLQLRGHIVGAHRGNKPVTCEFCKGEFNNNNITRHQRACPSNPTRDSQCPHCQKPMRASSIAKHVRTACPAIDYGTHPEGAGHSQKPAEPTDTPDSAEKPAEAESEDASEMDDAELFTVLEMILGESIPVSAIPVCYDWIATTRKLIAEVKGG